MFYLAAKIAMERRSESIFLCALFDFSLTIVNATGIISRHAGLMVGN
jgi:hypothetical protein